MKKVLLVLMLALCLMLTGCFGGQEIESCLFVLAMAVDPAPDEKARLWRRQMRRVAARLYNFRRWQEQYQHRR